MREQAADGPVVPGGAIPADGDTTDEALRVEFERTAREYRQALEEGMAQPFVMRLYVAGNSPRSRVAIENVRRVCTEYLCGRCEFEVIDLYQDVHRSRDDNVIAAPTLVKKAPLPRSIIIGDMTRTEKILIGLGVMARSA